MIRRMQLAAILLTLTFVLFPRVRAQDSPGAGSTNAARLPVVDIIAEAELLVAAISGELNQSRRPTRTQSTQLQLLALAIRSRSDSPHPETQAEPLQRLAQALQQAKTLEESRSAFAHYRQPSVAPEPPRSAPEIARPARGELMSILKLRSDGLRRAVRKPTQPAADSGHALMLALAAATLQDDLMRGTEANQPNSADVEFWQATCRQMEADFLMARTAMREGSGPVVDHFRRAMDGCQQCHDRFKR